MGEVWWSWNQESILSTHEFIFSRWKRIKKWLIIYDSFLYLSIHSSPNPLTSSIERAMIDQNKVKYLPNYSLVRYKFHTHQIEMQMAKWSFLIVRENTHRSCSPEILCLWFSFLFEIIKNRTLDWFSRPSKTKWSPLNMAEQEKWTSTSSAIWKLDPTSSLL